MPMEVPGKQYKKNVIGLVGGIASGKSFVAKEMTRLGAAVLDADRAGHEVLLRPDMKEAARQHWGDQIFRADGEIDRSALAKIVFAPPPDGPRELAYLEQLTHSRIGELLREQMNALALEAEVIAIVLDAPVMFKAGWNKFCDKIVFIDAPRETRLTRALARGWSQEDFARREAAQESLDVKRRLADVVIDNSGSPEFTRAQIEQVWTWLVG